MTNSNTASISFSRPEIKIDGEPRPDLIEFLVSFTVEQDLARPACCRLLVLNGGAQGTYEYFDLSHGDRLEVIVGPSGERLQIFEGRIDAIGGVYSAGEPPQLQVRAHDALERLRRRRVSQRFEEKDGLDVIIDIADYHGLSVNPQLGGGLVTHAHVTQANQTDLETCHRLARDMDACVFVKDGEIVVQPRGASDPNPVLLQYGDGLISFNCEANLSEQVSKISVHGWDPEVKEAIVETDSGDGISGEIDGVPGLAIATDMYGERVERLVHTVPRNTDTAGATAGARFGERARRFVTGHGVCDGDGQLRVGRRVELKGLGPWFDGQYMVVATTHRFDLANGYRTEFEAVRPDLGNA